jgi:hypothetical protein
VTVDQRALVDLARRGDHDAFARRIDPSGIITTVAGTGSRSFSGDCGLATSAALDNPNGLAMHGGVLYIADADSARIRMVVP